jgi:hypothetical protein
LSEAPDLERLALELVATLEDHEMKTAIGGAIAYGFWGDPRGTKDVDLNVFIGEPRYAELQALIEKSGLGPDPTRTAWTFEERARFVTRCREGAVAVAYREGIRVDFFVPSIPFYDEAERTIRRVDHPSGRSVPILSAEAISIFKLLFFRDKDLVDLRRIVARQGKALDQAYVRRQLEIMFPEGDERLETWDAIVRAHGGR